MTSYYRVEPGDRDPQDLLDPENQRTEPWSGTVRGRCDKCGGSGETEHEREDGSTYVDECPACKGSGEIDDSVRKGVSVFPDEDGLYRYMLGRDADLDEACQLVEIAGPESEDEDFDADEGALLILPERIVDVRSLDWERIERLRRDGN